MYTTYNCSYMYIHAHVYFVQISVLEEANKAHPGVWWWVKADGCDITAGLGESVRNEWSGDVDLADGTLETLQGEYMRRRAFVNGLGLEGRQGQWDVSTDLLTLHSELTADLNFIGSGTCVLCVYIYAYIHVRVHFHSF